MNQQSLSKTPEYVSAYNKLYQARNKKNLQEKRQAKDICDVCGKLISHSYITKHKNAKSCQKHKITQTEISLT